MCHPEPAAAQEVSGSEPPLAAAVSRTGQAHTQRAVASPTRSAQRWGCAAGAGGRLSARRPEPRMTARNDET